MMRARNKTNECTNKKKSKNRTCPTASWLNYSQLMHEFVKCNLKTLMTRTFFSVNQTDAMKWRTHKEKSDSNNDNYNQIENHKIGGNRSNDKHDNFCLLTILRSHCFVTKRKPRPDFCRQVNWIHFQFLIFCPRASWIYICIKLQPQVHCNWIFCVARDLCAW